MLRRASSAIAASVVLGGLLACGASASEASGDPDAAVLYEHLFPEHAGTVRSVDSLGGLREGRAGGFSGFRADSRRKEWSSAQVEAMKGAFKAPKPIAGASVSAEAESPFGPPPSELSDAPFGDLVIEYAGRRNLSPALVHQVILAESNYDPDAVSPKGARGLMQLMDALSSRFNIDPFDPESNISVGTQYLAELLGRFGSVDLALAAYNAGPGNVEKHGGIPPFKETQEYVKKINAGLALTEAHYP